MTTLAHKLKKLREHSQSNRTAEVRQRFNETMAEIKAKSGLQKGLPVGYKLDSFTAQNVFGEIVNLYEELKKGPVVLAFYRGEWCPYCNLQLRVYQEDLIPVLDQMGVQLIAVSPQLPDQSLSLEEKQSLPFQVLTDEGMKIAEQFNIVFEVNGYTKERYLSHNRDIGLINGTGEWTLPIPSVFVIDQNARIVFAALTPDWTERVEPDDIIQAVKPLRDATKK